MKLREILLYMLLSFSCGLLTAIGVTPSLHSNGYTLRRSSLLCNDKGCSILVEYPDQTRHWDYIQHKREEIKKK